MANPQRGEVVLVVDGERRVMRLTLGALAELEARLGATNLVELAEKFESGRVGTAELIALLAAGIRGGGHEIDEQALMRAEIGGGALGAMKAGLALLAATFRPDGEG